MKDLDIVPCPSCDGTRTAFDLERASHCSGCNGWGVVGKIRSPASGVNAAPEVNQITAIDGLDIQMIGGNCPVQAEGTINGKPFYFRARGQHWSLGIGDDPVLEETAEWYRWRKWGDGPYDAGWMPREDALKIIHATVADYLAGTAP